MDNFLKCKICGEETTHFTNHIINKHNTTIQDYFFKYYNIPVNYNYDILDNDLFKIVDEMQEEQATDCITHFKKILTEVDNNAARLQFRFTNSVYEIYHYLNIPLPKSSIRRKKKELQNMNESLAQEHKHHDMRVDTCHICGKAVKYGYMLWHAKSVHNIDKKDYLMQYYNIPADAEFDLLTYGLVKDMQYELQKYNGKFKNYKDCYQYIYNKFDNNITMIESFTYDITKFVKHYILTKIQILGLLRLIRKNLIQHHDYVVLVFAKTWALCYDHHGKLM